MCEKTGAITPLAQKHLQLFFNLVTTSPPTGEGCRPSLWATRHALPPSGVVLGPTMAEASEPKITPDKNFSLPVKFCLTPFYRCRSLHAWLFQSTPEVLAASRGAPPNVTPPRCPRLVEI